MKAHTFSPGALVSCHLDEIDAWRAARAWIQPMATAAQGGTAVVELRTDRIEAAGGGVMSLWVEGRVSAVAVILRDDFNRSILSCSLCS